MVVDRNSGKGLFARFAQNEATSGILLMFMAVLALAWANSPWSSSYFSAWNTPVSLSIGSFSIDKPILLWINDGLMAIFFFMVGLEIKREFLIGELATPRKAALPIVAAIGGMAVPAFLYLAFNIGGPGSQGWGIPMATDIAFALGILNLLGPRVPLALKIFLTAVAIVDDIGAVLVIALFYSADIQWSLVGLGFVLIGILLVLNRMGIRGLNYYLVPGILLWVLFLKSGIHATVAGVLLAFTIPTRVHLIPRDFASEAKSALDDFDQSCQSKDLTIMNEDQQSAIHQLEKACERAQMPLQRIEHSLQPIVNYLIMPLFALANAGVAIGSGAFVGLTQPIGTGIFFGLVVGKPIGVILAAWLATKAGIAALPDDVNWRQMMGVGILAGVGFTMSLFIGELAFSQPDQLVQAKIAILTASVTAGIAGYFLLRKAGAPA